MERVLGVFYHRLLGGIDFLLETGKEDAGFVEGLGDFFGRTLVVAIVVGVDGDCGGGGFAAWVGEDGDVVEGHAMELGVDGESGGEEGGEGEEG